MTENHPAQHWEQVSIEVALHLAEGLAAALGEILPGGVVLEKNYGDLFPDQLASYSGPVRLSGYFPAEMRGGIQRQISSLLESAGGRALLEKAEYSPLEDRDWATAWQERYRPIPVGEKLAVVPSWLENPYPRRIPIWMDPGMAFGSGTHPTTQLCLALLEKSLAESPSGEMIDVGCGSGILAIGAVKLGVGQVLGLDNDPAAVRIAGDNARANAVSAAAAFFEGSVKDLLGQEGLLNGASLVAANIIAPILAELFAEGLGELVLPGGRMILSGILKEQLPGILRCLEREGFSLLEQCQQGDWIGVIAEKGSDH